MAEDATERGREDGGCIYAGTGVTMRGAWIRRARHWVANRGWAGLGEEMVRRARMAMRGERARERPRETVPLRHPFDAQYGVETGGLIWGEQIAWGPLEETEAGRRGAMWATGYYGVAPSVFWAMLDRMALEWERLTFVDVGCGKGRALLLALRYPFRKALGVELSAELAAVAQQNLEQLRAPWRRPGVPAEAVVADATAIELPDGPVLLYLYHPFAAPVMRLFLGNVRLALERRATEGRPAEVYLLYTNPELDAMVMEQLPGATRMWAEAFALSAEDAAADRFGSHDERAVAYRLS